MTDVSIKRLTVLLDNDDLDCVKACCPEALTGALLVFEVEPHLRLRDCGIAHLTPWDLVEEGDGAELRRLEAEVWAFWRAHARAEFEGIDCLRMAQYRHACCFSRLTWPLFAIQRALATLQPQEVVTFEEPVGHGLDQPPGCVKMPLLFAMLRGMAEQAGIPVRLIRRTDVPGQSNFTDRVAPASRLRLPPVDPSTVLRGEGYALFHGSRVDLLRQLPVIAELHERDGLQAVQIYKTGRGVDVERARQQGHPVWHESQVTADTSEPTEREWMRQARSKFDDARAKAPPEVRAIFANRHMDIHFDFIFGRYLRRMAWQVRAWREFFNAHRPRVLVTDPMSPIIPVAHDMDIPCLVLPHGLMMLGAPMFYQLLPPVHIGAVSAEHRRRLVRSGLEPERICVVGDPAVNATRAAGQAGGAPLNGSRKHILLVTSAVSTTAVDAYLPETDWKIAVGCIEQLAGLAGRRADWEFVIRCHPRYDHPALYEWVNQSLPPGQKVLVCGERSLTDLVAWSDVIVVPNVKTSAMFEVSLGGKPVYLLDQSMIWHGHNWWGTQHWPHAGTVAELERELGALFGDSQHYAMRAAQT
ncbi:MAG: hypothetical protein GY842_09865, partial [bacterium]|nr:hypothetical protein [bacterium]